LVRKDNLRELCSYFLTEQAQGANLVGLETGHRSARGTRFGRVGRAGSSTVAQRSEGRRTFHPDIIQLVQYRRARRTILAPSVDALQGKLGEPSRKRWKWISQIRRWISVCIHVPLFVDVFLFKVEQLTIFIHTILQFAGPQLQQHHPE
jgi:hypothetical protein